jgi:phage head maturation protease
MVVKTQTRNVGPLSTRAAVGSVDVAKRTVDVVWTTGSRVLRNSFWDGPFFEELGLDPSNVRMGRLTSGTAPFLADHDGSSVASTLGVIESARLEKGQGIATVRFAAEGIDPAADMVFKKIADGVVRNVSVGYRTFKLEKVEGGDGNTPVFRATDWEPYEVSAVAMGADPSAGFRSETSLNECEFPTRGMPQTQKETQMTEEELKRAAEAEAKRAAELKSAQEAAVAQERERVLAIRSACAAGKLDASFADKLVADGTTADKARVLVLDAVATRNEQHVTEPAHISVSAVKGGDERDKFVRGVSAWAFEKSGNGLVEQAVKRGVKGFEDTEINGGQFRGMTLEHIARACLTRSGVAHANIYDRKRLFDLALTARAGAATSDFAVLFENVMYKSMRAAYAVQQDTWRRFCGTDTVQDFKESHRFLNGSFGTLPVVGENAEYQNIAVPDGSKLSISTETRGGIIGLSRQAMINDDMGALLDVAVRFGRTAGRSIEKAVYDLLALNSGLGPDLADTDPFFDNAARGNVSTGAALSVAALDADRLQMRQQIDADQNDYLDLMPSILLVSPSLESAAKILNESSYDHTSSAASDKPNVVKGMFADIVSSPRLSGTRRYLFTASKEALKVVFLEGSGEGPTMESQDGFRVDGTEWKARIDFKVNTFDPKHALTNAGV